MANRSPAPRPRPGEAARRPPSNAPVPAPGPTRADRVAQRRARRRQIIAGLLPAQAALILVVIAGMVTGAHSDVPNGPASSSTVVTVELAGAVCLVLLGLGIRGGLDLRRGRGRRFPWWALLSVPMFVFWAALRVSEYSG